MAAKKEPTKRAKMAFESPDPAQSRHWQGRDNGCPIMAEISKVHNLPPVQIPRGISFERYSSALVQFGD